MLYALLFMLLGCLSDRLHASEQPHDRLATPPGKALLLAENPEGEILDASDSFDRCLGSHRGPVARLQSAARVTPPAVTATARTDRTESPARQPSGAFRRLLPSGGRSALTAICRWRI